MIFDRRRETSENSRVIAELVTRKRRAGINPRDRNFDWNEGDGFNSPRAPANEKSLRSFIVGACGTRDR